MLRARLVLLSIVALAFALPWAWTRVTELIRSEPHQGSTHSLGSIPRVRPESAAQLEPVLFRVLVPGRVVDPHGRPASGAVIEAWLAGGQPRELCREVALQAITHAIADADGEFQMLVDEDKHYCLRARHESWLQSEPQPLSTGEDAGESVELLLRQGTPNG